MTDIEVCEVRLFECSLADNQAHSARRCPVSTLPFVGLLCLSFLKAEAHDSTMHAAVLMRLAPAVNQQVIALLDIIVDSTLCERRLCWKGLNHNQVLHPQCYFGSTRPGGSGREAAAQMGRLQSIELNC